MAQSFAGMLEDEMGGDVRVFFFYEAFDLFSEIADHKDELLESCLLQAVDDKTKNGFSRHRNKWFRLRVSMWSQSHAHTGNGDNSLHSTNIQLQGIG